MEEITEETIEVMKKLVDTLKDTNFRINRFEVGTNGEGLPTLDLDIRKEQLEE